MKIEEVYTAISDAEAIEFNRKRVEILKVKREAVLTLSLEEREQIELLSKAAVVEADKKTGLTTGVWSLEQVQEILEKKLDGWQNLIKPVKMELAVQKGLLKPEEVFGT